MIAIGQQAFADTSWLVALVHNKDEHHERAQLWSDHVSQITTTTFVVAETAGGLARTDWRPHVVRLIDHLSVRDDVRVIEITTDLFRQGWDLYRQRMDKSWSLVDCTSFIVMNQFGLRDALTADHHFEQAGYRALLLEEPA